MIEQNGIIQLPEYETRSLGRDELTDNEAQQIYALYGDKIFVEWPSPKTQNRYQLTSLGWVGFIPFGRDRGISLQPKVPLGNLFSMLEYAYDLESFKLWEGLFDSESILGFYERLAKILANRFLLRARDGLYKTYREEQQELSFVRGRIDFQKLIHSVNKSVIPCQFEDHTIDIEDNQIIAWTLYTIIRTRICSERTLPLIQKAERVLRNSVTLKPFFGHNCIDRTYNRLNEDYEVLHKLCRFFLENTGPTQNLGDRTMVPFVVNMARLFELFVARWLQKNIDPNKYILKSQEKLALDACGDLKVIPDLVLYDVVSRKPICILDTKYKAHQSVLPDDICKITAYAEFFGCSEAVLIYPKMLSIPSNIRPGKIRVRSLAFDLSKDINLAGQEFLRSLQLSLS